MHYKPYHVHIRGALTRVLIKPSTWGNNKELDHTLWPVYIPVCAQYGFVCAQRMSLGGCDRPRFRPAIMIAKQCFPRRIVLPPHVSSGGETVVVRCVPGIKVDSNTKLREAPNNRCQLRAPADRRMPLVIFRVVWGTRG
jgi:hypothetical protein